jgi:hypothetical protein
MRLHVKTEDIYFLVICIRGGPFTYVDLAFHSTEPRFGMLYQALNERSCHSGFEQPTIINIQASARFPKYPNLYI